MADKYKMDGNKLLWHMDRVDEHFKHGKRIYPLLIDMGVTKFCNAKCSYCYGVFQKITGDMIPRESLLDIFGTAADMGIKALTAVGDGEPTLNPAIYEAIELGKSKGVDIGFATNGIALDHNKLLSLTRSCVWIRFNLSAATQEGYKKIHGVDKWETVKQNIIDSVSIRDLVFETTGHKATIGLQMVLTPNEIGEVLPEAKFAINAGVDYFVIKQYSQPGCEGMSDFDLNWYDKPETLAILKQAEDMSNAHTQIIVKWNRMNAKGQRKYDHCVDCALLFQISGNGKAYPCGYLFNGPEKYCYGDLTKQTLRDILNSEQYWKVVKHMREEFDVHTECKGECRHSSTNQFIWDYLHPPEHKTFI